MRMPSRPKNPAPKHAAKRESWPAFGRAIARTREVVLMVRAVEALEMPGVTDEGLKLQAAPVGRPEQEKF